MERSETRLKFENVHVSCRRIWLRLRGITSVSVRQRDQTVQTAADASGQYRTQACKGTYSLAPEGLGLALSSMQNKVTYVDLPLCLEVVQFKKKEKRIPQLHVNKDLA